MQFVVPQFIDVEDKIFGPFGIRQFLIMIGGAVFMVLAYRFADFTLFLLEAVVIIFSVLLFAFFRVNGQPFHLFVLHLTQSLRRPGKRVWRRVVSDEELRLPTVAMPAPHQVTAKAPLSQSRLNELALIVDTGGAYKQEEYV